MLIRIVNTGTGDGETVVVDVAPGTDDWKASTRAMLATTLRFRGETPAYYEFKPDGTERRMDEADSPGAVRYPGDGWGTR